MTWRVQVEHRSTYRYDEAVAASYNEARMTPVTDPHQTAINAAMDIDPAPTGTLRYWDYWGTQVTAFDLHDPHDQLVVSSRCIVETESADDPPAGATWRDLDTDEIRDAFDEFLRPTAYTPYDGALAERARGLRDGADLRDVVRLVSSWAHSAMTYEQGVTQVHTSALDALASGRGVCQDYAHLTLVLLRSLGVPARYVSGYFHPTENAPIGAAVMGQSHAWVEAFTGEWWGYDPTNDLPIGERHVIVARGRDYADVAPIRGLYAGGASSSVSVDVKVTRLQ